MRRTNAVLLSVATVVAAMAITAGPAGALDKNSTPVSSSDAIPSVDGSSFRSINSVEGGQAAPAVSATVSAESGGFDWEDAFVGAAVTLGLVLISLATVRELRRHRKVAVGSSA